MLLLLIPQGVAAAALDVAGAVRDVVYRLGFQNDGDLAASGAWVTATELYQWADEAAKRLSYEAGLFVGYDDSITVVAGTAVYTLPASHVFTLLAALGAAALRITPVRDLEALDATWAASSGAAARASLDAGGVGTITLYPNPVTGGTLGQICQKFPAAITAVAHTVSLPGVLRDYFGYVMLAGARGKESEAAMPEMAAHFVERVKLYERVIAHLWGAGQ